MKGVDPLIPRVLQYPPSCARKNPQIRDCNFKILDTSIAVTLMT